MFDNMLDYPYWTSRNDNTKGMGKSTCMMSIFFNLGEIGVTSFMNNLAHLWKKDININIFWGVTFNFHRYFRLCHFVPTILVACRYQWEK